MNYQKKRFASLDTYFEFHKPKEILDFITDLRTIATACGMHRSEVRASLPRFGYVKSITENGVRCWKLAETTKNE